jgi:hypothetical protein
MHGIDESTYAVQKPTPDQPLYVPTAALPVTLTSTLRTSTTAGERCFRRLEHS